LGILQGFIIRIVISILDYVWFGWYTIMELIRNVMFGVYSMLPWWIKDDEDYHIPYHYDIIGHSNDRTNRISGERYEFNYSIPDLESDDKTIVWKNENPNTIKGKNGNHRHNPTTYHVELEPAFLWECDFPEGWMVYHPVLGVVTKVVADTYYSEGKNNYGITNVSRLRHDNGVRVGDSEIKQDNNSEMIKHDNNITTDPTNDVTNGVTQTIPADDHDICVKRNQSSNIQTCYRSVVAT
jgi:hypothetical protein